MEKTERKAETFAERVHPSSMGRDELNLAEFPLATLADKAPRGCKTLAFEDQIWDRSRHGNITRRLTITASDKYGLPNALDDEVIVGLMQLSKADGFADRRVRFSRYQLVHLLGWREEGKSYQRLETSLKRWLGVTLYYENAWWEKSQKRWVDAHFHLLDDLVLCRPPRGKVSASLGNRERLLSSFTWNEIMFSSFEAGYLKKLDLDLYRRLNRSTAKRVYRFLDKRFHFRNHLRLDLRRFACEHVGLSRNYDTAQLRRRLNPAIVELENAGYLEPMAAADRFRRLRQGQWEVVFRRMPRTARRTCDGRRWSTEEQALIDRGVTPTAAVRLVRDFPVAFIRSKISAFDALRKEKADRISRNPAGYLVKSIRDDYQTPLPLRIVSPSSSPRRIADGPCGQGADMPRRRRGESVANRVEKRILDFLSNVPAEERVRLEQDALAKARGMVAEGLRRAVASGNEKRAGGYRQVIVHQHVRSLLGDTAGDA